MLIYLQRMSNRGKKHPRRLLLLVCVEQVDPKAGFTSARLLSLHAAHQTSQQVELLLGQRVGGVVMLGGGYTKESASQLFLLPVFALLHTC